MSELLSSPWLYPAALAVISVLTLSLEFAFKLRREQRQLRPYLWSDVLHLVFNGHVLGVIIYGLAVHRVLPHLDDCFASLGWTELVYRNAAQAWPIGLQILVAVFIIDLLQWGVHNLLHRIPALWEFHKTHHSVIDGEMDWIVSFRFQWTEVVIYRSLLFLPLAWFGFGLEAILSHAIFGTLTGHLNHSNLSWDYGPLRYVLNSPRMHLWHHDYEGDARTTVNFGIIFSLWDWLFGTAKLPNDAPARIGFAGVERFPRDFFGQMAWPLGALLPATRWSRVVAAIAGLALISVGYAYAEPHLPSAQPRTSKHLPTDPDEDLGGRGIPSERLLQAAPAWVSAWTRCSRARSAPSPFLLIASASTHRRSLSPMKERTWVSHDVMKSSGP